MERRYLVAALGIVATFATFSSGFQSLQHISLLRGQHPSALSRWAAKVRTHLRPAYPEEAQLLAEMNLPMATHARLAEQALQQSQTATRCARETAIREAERARRDATRMRQQIAGRNISPAPIALDLKALDNLDQRMQVNVAALAQRVTAANMRLQISGAKLEAISMQTRNPAGRQSPCRSRAEVR